MLHGRSLGRLDYICNGIDLYLCCCNSVSVVGGYMRVDLGKALAGGGEEAILCKTVLRK